MIHVHLDLLVDDLRRRTRGVPAGGRRQLPHQPRRLRRPPAHRRCLLSLTDAGKS
jgi:hypothetical protein